MQKHNFRRLFIDNLTLSDKLSQQCLNYLKKAAYDLYTHLVLIFEYSNNKVYSLKYLFEVGTFQC